jgi:hypothetical protein
VSIDARSNCTQACQTDADPIHFLRRRTIANVGEAVKS